MKTKNTNPMNYLKHQDAPALLQIYFEFNQLKNLYRQGWLRSGVPDRQCETVAEHTLGVAILTLLIVNAHFPDLDLEKAISMALIHDFGEIFVGDLTPSDEIGQDQKYLIEKESVAQIFSHLSHSEHYLALWEEFEDGRSPEAILVKQLDKLEMSFQACIYEHQRWGNLSQFYKSAEDVISLEILQEILDEIKSFRPDG